VIRDSVDLLARGSDPNKVVRRVKLVDGKLVAEGGSWVEDLITKPHGSLAFHDRLVDPSEGRAFLAAMVEQYDGSGLRARWTPGEDATLAEQRK
jgi:hypothetical protein